MIEIAYTAHFTSEDREQNENQTTEKVCSAQVLKEVPQKCKENDISYAITCISFLNGTFLGLLCFALGFSLGGMDHQSSYRLLEL